MKKPLKIEELHWEITNHCNFRCVHCYLADDARRELSTEECYRILYELYAAGVLHLTLSGGEPLLRRDFKEIYRKAHSLGFLINVFTNGSLITEDIIALFTKHPPQKVEITLNGITKGTFEAVTDKKNSFEATMEGIQKLTEAGIFLGLKTNGMTLNQEEVLQIKAFANSFENCFFKFDAAIMPKRNYDDSPTQFRLAPKEIIALYEKDSDMKAQIAKECATSDFYTPEERKVFQCSAGKSRFHLSPWGDLHPCHTVRNIKRSLREMSLLAAAQMVNAQVESLVYPKDSACGSCKIFSQCDSCPGLADLENRSSVLRAEYHCDVAHKTIQQYAPHLLEDAPGVR